MSDITAQWEFPGRKTKDPIEVVHPQRVLVDKDVKGKLEIYAAQMNTRVGDIKSNTQAIIKHWQQADVLEADLAVTPELSISGYPLEDLVENPELLDACEKALEHLIEESKNMKSGLIVGLPMKGAPDEYGRDIYNCAVLIENGKVLQKIRKQHLPNHDVFDEVRNFAKGAPHDPVNFRGCKLGLLICEDVWHKNVAAHLKGEGAQALISINSSPYESGKQEFRINEVVRERVVETGLPLFYLNQWGGQDEVVFDGASFAMNANLMQTWQARHFEEDGALLTLKFPEKGHAAFEPNIMNPIPSYNERDYRALVVGLRDYLAKTGHKEVVLGMSGGLDSALVAAIAVDAIGAENVHLIGMPSRFTADISNEDAKIAADMLGAEIEFLPIEEPVNAFRNLFQNKATGTADENIQARTRGIIIMMHSNQNGWLALSTGNKSEVAVGYCTLYGDMNGGFNPIKDLYKTRAFELAKWRNVNMPEDCLGPIGKVMPSRIYTRPPSAELSEDQVDTNSLPPYERLDPILKAYIEDHASIAQIITKTGEDEKLVADIIKKVDIAEFKRRQACPGTKITLRSFGRGRRYPIARPHTSAMALGVNALRAKP
jgi:NAD+ synthase